MNKYHKRIWIYKDFNYVKIDSLNFKKNEGKKMWKDDQGNKGWDTINAQRETRNSIRMIEK